MSNRSNDDDTDDYKICDVTDYTKWVGGIHSNISDQDKAILYGLTGEEHLKTRDQPKKVFGEVFYLKFRSMLHDDETLKLVSLKDLTVVPSQNQKKITTKDKNKEKISKVDQMKIENSTKMVNKFFTETLEQLKHHVVSNPSGIPIIPLRHEYLEINGIAFLYLLFHLRTNTSTYLSNDEISLNYFSFVANIILTTKKFINDVSEQKYGYIISCKSEVISRTLLHDVMEQLNFVIGDYHFNGFDIIKYCPSLITDNGFKYFKKEVTPHTQQILLTEKVKEYFESGFLIIQNSVIGSGKTTGLFGLIKLVSDIKKQDQYPHLEVLYICNKNSVRSQFVKLCGHANIKFGIFKSGRVTIINKHGIKSVEHRSAMVNHPECNNYIHKNKGGKTHRLLIGKGESVDGNLNIVSDRCVTITNLSGAIELLSNCHQDKYIVCFDEPNDEAHDINSNELMQSMKIIKLFQKRSVLISGTFPDPHKIHPIIENVKSKHPTVVVDIINTKEIAVGCLVQNYTTGEVFLPFYGTKNKQELEKIIMKLETSPFLSRSCENNVLCHLYEQMIINDIDEVNYLNDYFNNIDNITSDNIKSACINMLKILLTRDDHLIESICSVRFFRSPLSLNNLGTYNAHKLSNGATIIASNTPTDTTFEMFADLLDEINKQKITLHTLESLTSCTDDHDEMNSNETLPDIDENSEIVNPNRSHKMDLCSARKCRYQSFTNMTKLYSDMCKYYARVANNPKVTSEIRDVLTPKFLFDDGLQINSQEHQKKYFGRTLETSRNLNRLQVEQFSNTRVNDDIISLFVAGIGIYDLNDPRLDKPYLHMVLNFALQGKLSYIVSNRDICYGVSMPVYNVMSLDSFSQNCSIYDIGQLSGRAGRRNKSTSARLYLGNEGFERYLNYAKDSQEDDKYVLNMLEVFSKL